MQLEDVQLRFAGTSELSIAWQEKQQGHITTHE